MCMLICGFVVLGIWHKSRFSHNVAHMKTLNCGLISLTYVQADLSHYTKQKCLPSEDSDQAGHPPSLIRVFAVRLMGSSGPKLSLCGQRRLWSDWADAQADLSLLWVHSHFVGFVMTWLIQVFWLNVVFFFFFQVFLCYSFTTMCLIQKLTKNNNNLKNIITVCKHLKAQN